VRVASPKSPLSAASTLPLIAPAEAPVTMRKGEGAWRNAGTSPRRFNTPA
jgi:hypothetical protein